jgi:TonB system transport protein ExbD (group 1)
MAIRLDEPDGGDGVLHEINVTPFIDVILVLLIVFMVAAPLATVDMPVDLPAARARPLDRPPEPLFLTLNADGSLALGEAAVSLEGLAEALGVATGGDRERRVFLRADKTVVYERVMAALDALRAAGYAKLALVARDGGTAP